ncbi:restriction endonuclease subunit S [Serratia ureilytica]|uniref:restriction endonuclease subunit S n=1 Tax=Serratia ureilytica TaxID=300181 RepID=UPI001BD09BFA|nr:restriction endonuclease subunit S [Serratia ureilytica]MBS7521905.1 restriction endonuclease subunit S [Serratia ureilytica]
MSFEWKKYTIADVSKNVVTGKTPPGTLEKYFGGDVLFVTPTDMGDNKYIERTQRTLSDEGEAKLAKQRFECGIVVSCIGWQMGKSAIVKNAAVTNQQINTIIPNNEIIDVDFLYYTLSDKRTEIFNLGATATRTPILKKSLFEKIEFYAPKLEQQKKIGNILSCLDDKIINNRKINQTLEQMAQTLFKSWFVDFEPVKAKIAVLEAGGAQEDATRAAMTAISGKDADALAVFKREHPEQYAKLKATAEQFPSAVQDSELGEIPEGWEVSDIKSSVSELRRGISPKYTDDADGIMVINQKCIRNHTINFSLARRHDGKIRSTSGRELQIGDILVNSTGVGTLGRLAPVRYKSEILIADSHVTVVRADTKKITKSFLSELLTKHEKHIESSGSGSTGQTELRKETLEEIKFPCPPVILGQLFDEIVNNFNKKISIMEEQMIALSNLRDTLLPKLLSGEITLPEAEQAVSEAENV